MPRHETARRSLNRERQTNVWDPKAEIESHEKQEHHNASHTQAAVTPQSAPVDTDSTRNTSPNVIRNRENIKQIRFY